MKFSGDFQPLQDDDRDVVLMEGDIFAFHMGPIAITYLVTEITESSVRLRWMSPEEIEAKETELLVAQADQIVRHAGNERSE